ncbi:hypothetical protein BX616_009097, partial [Lobosporangium transversale]
DYFNKLEGLVREQTIEALIKVLLPGLQGPQQGIFEWEFLDLGLVCPETHTDTIFVRTVAFIHGNQELSNIDYEKLDEAGPGFAKPSPENPI